MIGSSRDDGSQAGVRGAAGARRRRVVRWLGAACVVLALACAVLAVEVAVLSASSSQNDSSSPPAVVQNAMKDAPAAATASQGDAGVAALPRGPWEDSYRLPAQAQPLHYLLTLRPDLASGSFSGDVVITVAVTSPVSYLAVHAKHLEVLATNVTRDEDAAGGTAGGVTVPLRAAFAYPPHELWVLQPQEEGGFAPAQYRLRFAFRGNLTGKIVGFYRSQYWDDTTRRQR